MLYFCKQIVWTAVRGSSLLCSPTIITKFCLVVSPTRVSSLLWNSISIDSLKSYVPSLVLQHAANAYMFIIIHHHHWSIFKHLSPKGILQHFHALYLVKYYWQKTIATLYNIHRGLCVFIGAEWKYGSNSHWLCHQHGKTFMNLIWISPAQSNVGILRSNNIRCCIIVWHFSISNSSHLVLLLVVLGTTSSKNPKGLFPLPLRFALRGVAWREK